ncbi:ATP-binding protein [Spirosoma lituiforme]
MCPAVRPVVVDSRFGSASVNDRVLIYKVAANQKHPTKPIPETTSAGFLPNTDSQHVLIGPAYAYPEAWVYLPLVNPTGSGRNLIVDLDHNRCDTLDAYLLRGHQRPPIQVEKLFRGLPPGQRAVPVRDFALSFELVPHDSVGLLLHSHRTTGIHELSIALSTEKQFFIKNDGEAIIRIAALTSAFFFVFTVCSLGLIFNHRLLVYFGLYVLPVAVGQLNYNYFFDGFPFPSWLGLNANSVGLFIIFLANSLLHPFGVAYLKNLNLYGRWQRYAVLVLVVANLIQMLLLLFPLSALTNVIVTRASLLLTTLNIGWLFYISVVGFIKKREVYLLLTVTLVFLPVLYRTYGQSTPALSYSHFQPFYLLLVFGFLIVSLFRRELISRQMTEQTIRQVQTNLEQLRKAEIEQIGRNLHDQLGNTLASALGYLTMQAPRITLARDMILEAINETRVISHNLVKDDERVLTEKLDDLADRFNDFSPISFSYVDFTEQQINQLTPLKQQGIYQIVQEVLNNIIKHSEAKEVTIQAFLSEGVVRVSIDDDGIGYTPTAQTSGIGIGNMHKRAKLANLKLVIDGGYGGTSVSIETPLAD